MGNLIYRQLPNGENQYYQYDLENQLVRAEIKKSAGNTEIWTYAYDLFGRRLSKERQDKLAWTSTEPKRTHFVWDGTRLLQEYTYKGCYTYIYTDQDSYEPLAQVFDNAKDGKQYLSYFHTDQIGIPREMTDIHGNLLWYGEYTAWGRLKKDERVYKNAHQPFRLQNQYFDEETGLHYNLMRYYEPEAGRFVNQDPIGLLGGENLYSFAPSVQAWFDPLGLEKCSPNKKEFYNAKSRREAFRRAKRDSNIPNSLQPTKIRRVLLDDGYGNKVLDSNYQPIQVREYFYEIPGRETIVIQEHSLGHTKAEINKGREPHFNVRPESNTNTGSVSGTYGHYNFKKKR